MTDEELIVQIIPLWHAEMEWAKELLKRSFALQDAESILTALPKGRHEIPCTNWFIRTHGFGVDIFRTPSVGGIDFDFNSPAPDAWKLKIFFEKQFNDGQLQHHKYMHLADDEELLDKAIESALANNSLTHHSSRTPNGAP